VKWFQIPCEKLAPKNLLEISHRDGESGHDDVKTCLEERGWVVPKPRFSDRRICRFPALYSTNLPGERKKDRQVDFLGKGASKHAASAPQKEAVA